MYQRIKPDALRALHNLEELISNSQFYPDMTPQQVHDNIMKITIAREVLKKFLPTEFVNN